MLKLQIKEIMEDYRKRINIINDLKDSLSNLNLSIQNSQDQTQELKDKSDKYEEKIKIKEN